MNNYFKILNSLIVLADAKTMKTADNYTINKFCISSKELINKAGYHVAKIALTILKKKKTTSILIICGSGKNGDDGLTAGKYLIKKGFYVNIFYFKKSEQFIYNDKNNVLNFIKYASNHLQNDNYSINLIDKIDKLKNFLKEKRPKVIIDAILGIGINRKVSGIILKIIKIINNYRLKENAKILSIDIPSGIHCDGKNPHYPHILADKTITFSRLKIAHLLELSAISCGKILCKNIGVKFKDKNLLKYLGFLKKDQPPIKLLKNLLGSEHKGSFGHLAILEGALETRGASRLAAMASLKSGCGSVTLIVSKKINILLNNINEIMFQNIYNINDIFLKKISSILIGPGLSDKEINKKQAKYLIHIASNKNIPLVIDADALFLLNEIHEKKIKIIATPHPGEAAKLLNLSIKKVQKNRIKTFKLLLKLPINKQADIVWILKGASPIIGKRKGSLIICEGLVPSLSIAGSGDVLAGIIGSFLAQGYNLIESSLLGVGAHLQAGRILQNQSTRGHLASEISNILPKILFN